MAQTVGDAAEFPDENPSPVLRFAADGTDQPGRHHHAVLAE
jgi:hypothetical protein